MILKMPLSKCIIIKENELSKELVLKNDIFKICTGCVDQYIVNKENQLCGVISSFDIEGGKKLTGDFDVYSIINRYPVSVVRSDRFERRLVENIFEETWNIRSVPIVNQKGEIQYVYIKINSGLEKFVSQNFLCDAIQYENLIKTEIKSIKNQYPKLEIHILSDFEKYGISLGEMSEYYIHENEIDSLQSNKDFVHLVFLYEFNCMKVIGKLIEKNIKYSGSNYTGKNIIEEVMPYFKMDEIARDVLEEEVYYNGNYFDLNDFQNIFQAIRMTEHLKGDYVEIGTYRGDSAKAALSFMKKNKIKRKSFFLDTYEGFNYLEAENSSDSLWKNTHDDTSIEFVKERLKEFSDYQLVKMNIITDRLPNEIEAISVCNIDVDMYEAVAASLEKVNHKVLTGGVIIAEDFGHTPDLYGAQYAILDFYFHNKDRFHGIYLQSGQFMMIKK